MATTTAIKEPKLKDIRRNDISTKRHIILENEDFGRTSFDQTTLSLCDI
jgi:hypothetical protein